jgi:hypothetical protein
MDKLVIIVSIVVDYWNFLSSNDGVPIISEIDITTKIVNVIVFIVTTGYIECYINIKRTLTGVTSP